MTKKQKKDLSGRDMMTKHVFSFNAGPKKIAIGQKKGLYKAIPLTEGKGWPRGESNNKGESATMATPKRN